AHAPAPGLPLLRPHVKNDSQLLAPFPQRLPPSMRTAFEFRHSSWFDDEIFEILRKRNCALCIADTDKLETPVIATADWGYLRLRWEDYQPADVSRWAQAITEKKTLWSDAFAYFKHEE